MFLLGKTMVLYGSRMMEYIEGQNQCCLMTQLLCYSYDTTHLAWGTTEFEKVPSASVKSNSQFGIKHKLHVSEGFGKYLDLRRMSWQL
jgi:hypothetical protein